MGIWILWIGCVASRSNFVCTNPCRTHKLDHDDGSLDGVGHACSWLTTSKYSSICLCSNSIDTQCKSAGVAFFFVRTLALVATIYAWWCASAMTLNQMQLLFHEIFWYWSLDWLFGESVKNDSPTDESNFRIRCTYFVHKHRNFHVTFHFISLYATRTANKLFALLEFCDKVAKKARGKSRAPDFRAINIWIFCQPTSQHVIREMKRRGNKNGKRCV